MEEKRVIAFASSPDFSGNSKALYQEIAKREEHNCELIWVVSTIEMKRKLETLNINVIYEKDDDFLEKFKQIQILFITHNNYLDIKLQGQTYISLWHGIGPKKTGYSLQEQREINFAKYYAEKIDELCVSSEFAQMLFMYIYDLPFEKVVKCEQARNVHIRNSNGKQNLEKLLDIDLNKYKKVIMYCPTFRKGIGKEEGIVNANNLLGLEEYEEEKLNRFLEENKYFLILKLHPAEENAINTAKMGKNVAILEDKKMLEELITVNEVLNGADCLITDYSSIYTDFLTLKRPVIFLTSDFEKYTKDRGIYFGSKEFWYPGPTVNKIEEFCIEIEKLLSNNDYYKKEREKYITIINGTDTCTTDEFIDNFVLKLEPKLKIPKKIHYFSKTNYTKKEARNINEWKTILKDYEIIEWDLNGEEIKAIMEKNNIEELANIDNIILLKMEILYKYGGVFLEPNIQILSDIEPLLFNKEILIKDKYNSRLNHIIGASKGNEFIETRIEEGWLDIEHDQNIKVYEYKDVFVGDCEQWRIGKKDFQDKDKYFNNTDISARNTIGRIIKYGLCIDNRKEEEKN